ncbi:MAG: GGDEF domain-containing protein [Lachnospiraceae bacterium]|nr:GGDEF domain-containing protein [Lachnospiraceae bacterium]
MLSRLRSLALKKTGVEERIFKHTVILRVNLCLMILYFVCFSAYSATLGANQGAIVGGAGLLLMSLLLFATYRGWSGVAAEVYCMLLSAVSLGVAILYGSGVAPMVFMLIQIMVLFTVNLLDLKSRLAFAAMLVAFYLFLFNFMEVSEPVYALAETDVNLLRLLHYFTGGLITFGIMGVTTVDSQLWEKDLIERNESLRTLAAFDSLTGISNRTAITEVLNKATSLFQKAKLEALTVAIADIDFFKRVNDTYGHNCGDIVLKEVAFLMRDFMEGKGKVGRWGGEEFLFVFYNMNGEQVERDLYDLQGRLRRLVVNYENYSFNVTLTFGVAEYSPKRDVLDTIEEADRKLYMGKQAGRNVIVF